LDGRSLPQAIDEVGWGIAREQSTMQKKERYMRFYVETLNWENSWGEGRA